MRGWASKPGLDLAPHLCRTHRTECCKAVCTSVCNTSSSGKLAVRASERERERERRRMTAEDEDEVGGGWGWRRPSNLVFAFVRPLAHVAHIHIFISTPLPSSPWRIHTETWHVSRCSYAYVCVRVKRTRPRNVTVFHVDAREAQLCRDV